MEINEFKIMFEDWANIYVKKSLDIHWVLPSEIENTDIVIVELEDEVAYVVKPNEFYIENFNSENERYVNPSNYILDLHKINWYKIRASYFDSVIIEIDPQLLIKIPRKMITEICFYPWEKQA